MKNKIVKEYTLKYMPSEIWVAIFYIGMIALSLVGPYLMEYFIDVIIPNKNMKHILYFAIFFMCIYLIMLGLAVTIKYLIVRLENNIAADLRNRMFANTIYQPIKYYKEHQLGATMERVLKDTGVVHSIWGYLFPSIFSSLLTFVATFMIVFTKSYIIGLLSLVAIGCYVFVFKYFNEKLRTLFWKARGDVDEMNAAVTDAWNGAKEIKAFQIEGLVINRFKKINTLLKKHNCEMEIQEEFSSQLMSLATTLGTLITLVVGGYFVMKGDMTIGALVAIQAYVAKLYTPAQNIADMAVDYKVYQVNLQRMEEILGLTGENPIDDKNGMDLSGEIRFENIDFSYDKTPVLKNLTFTLGHNGQVAIVGPSGAGKSTILNLLLGFENPIEGKIVWGDTELGKSNYGMLRQNIALASQDAYLFNMSVYDNIKIGNPNASEEEIQRIIKLLEIDRIAEKFPNKLNTIVSEMGKNISGGQLQRISIARALIKNTPVLILDEATSNIDSQSEQLIQDILSEFKKRMLIIIVSHRLSSLKNSDKILVIEEGELKQEGTLEELAVKEGVFKTLFEEQL